MGNINVDLDEIAVRGVRGKAIVTPTEEVATATFVETIHRQLFFVHLSLNANAKSNGAVGDFFVEVIVEMSVEK